MKITGPGTSPGAPSEAPREGASAPDGDAKKIDQAGAKGSDGGVRPEAAGRSFAETLAAGRTAPPTSAAKAATGADALTSDIAADLKAGKIDPKAALDRVVERVLDQQLGVDAPPSLRAELRDALRDTISSDPFLTERLRGLG